MSADFSDHQQNCLPYRTTALEYLATALTQKNASVFGMCCPALRALLVASQLSLALELHARQEVGVVARAIDGDTIVVRIGDRNEQVRLATNEEYPTENTSCPGGGVP